MQYVQVHITHIQDVHNIAGPLVPYNFGNGNETETKMSFSLSLPPSHHGWIYAHVWLILEYQFMALFDLQLVSYNSPKLSSLIDSLVSYKCFYTILNIWVPSKLQDRFRSPIRTLCVQHSINCKIYVLLYLLVKLLV